MSNGQIVIKTVIRSVLPNHRQSKLQKHSGIGEGMAKNDGKPYEQFVQRVFQQIKNLEGVNTVRVEPSKVFDGNTVDESGNPISHQIDVHWTFEL